MWMQLWIWARRLLRAALVVAFWGGFLYGLALYHPVVLAAIILFILGAIIHHRWPHTVESILIKSVVIGITIGFNCMVVAPWSRTVAAIMTVVGIMQVLTFDLRQAEQSRSENTPASNGSIAP